MKPFIFGKWHAWEGTAHVILSNEDIKELHYFANTDNMVNWLYLIAKDEDAARALNAHVKAG